MNLTALSPDTHSAAEIVRLMQLEPLDQEGGFFRRPAEASGLRPDGRRAWSTIYFLVTPEGFSAMHRLVVDEIWCFHAGDPVEALRLQPDGTGGWVRLGFNLAAGEVLQHATAAGVWQGTRLAPGGRWALVSCVVVPEFRWGDFELADRSTLAKAYPGFSDGIVALTRNHPVSGVK
jgi:predicted cupin superfamily sugar epimerase